jgi:hypothetical protein
VTQPGGRETFFQLIAAAAYLRASSSGTSSALTFSGMSEIKAVDWQILFMWIGSQLSTAPYAGVDAAGRDSGRLTNELPRDANQRV